jgi:putative tricarboxylic transport membrane protein
LFTQAPDLVWAIIASMFLGNLILLLLNLPLAGLFAQLLRVPYAILYPIILALCIAGVFAAQNSMDDLWLMCGFGVLGYVLKRTDFPIAPIILGLVLEPLLENALRQSMTLSHGSLAIFVERPISLAMLVAIFLMVAVPTAARIIGRLRAT